MTDKGSAFVIGSGAAGRAAARTLARSGWSVRMAEHAKVGGTCLWTGCTPKKALFVSAESARNARRMESLGVSCTNISVDWQGVLAWKWHSQETFAGDQEALAAQSGIEIITGTARFVSPSEVEVEGARYRADQFVIATGSRPLVPQDLPGHELVDTSDDALRFPELPSSLVIVGGGFVAMEMAGIFASFGTKVTMLVRASRPLEMLDADLAAVAVRRLESMGVVVHTGATLTSIDGARGQLAARFTDALGATRSVAAERVLMATGRRPEFGMLDLEAAGVELENGRIVHDAFQRTTNPNVWVAGDAAGGVMQTPIANMEGRTVAMSIASGEPTPPDCRAVPITVFTVPQLATVGMTEDQAAAANRAVDVHRIEFDDISSAIIEDERDGFAKLVLDDADGAILGAQMAGPTACDCIYSAAVAVRAGWKVTDLAALPAVHPSFAEAFYYAS
ncbi:MAG: NAD(P)/FAD-dependent oxidoreductase [Coriobacteriales bacterium]|nr:NAD(P)/FAD-dependent oxidoreductase [Coriobacteriales bacterium]